VDQLRRCHHRPPADSRHRGGKLCVRGAESSLEAIYSILILSLGILVIGLVMRRADLGKGTAYVGIATGVMGIVAALGPFFASA